MTEQLATRAVEVLAALQLEAENILSNAFISAKALTYLATQVIKDFDEATRERGEDDHA